MIRVKRIVNSLYQSNSYIIHCEEYDWVWLIDVGDTKQIQEWINSNNLRLKSVLLTHTHYDHIYGLNDINQLFHKLTIYTSSEGRKSLYNDKWNFSKYHHTPFKFAGCNVVELCDGDKVELWPDVTMKVVKTPGHDWSCLSYLVGNMLFSGDSYIPGTKTVTFFPKSNKIEAEESLLKIMGIPGIEIIYPGHGKPVPISKADLFRQ